MPNLSEKKIHLALGFQASSLPELVGVEPELERTWGGHACVSQATLRSTATTEWMAEIAGQHHAFFHT